MTKRGPIAPRLVISLEDADERRKTFTERHPHLGFEFVSAVDMRGADERKVRLNFDSEGFRRRYGRPPAPAEAGCTLSHLNAMERIAASGAGAVGIISEDDTIFEDDVIAALANVNWRTTDLVRLSFETTTELGSGSPLSPITRSVAKRRCGIEWPFPGTSSAGYAIRGDAARRIVAQQRDRLPSHLADDFVYCRDLGLVVARIEPLAARVDFGFESSIDAQRGEQREGGEQPADSTVPHRVPDYLRFNHRRRRRQAVWFRLEEGWRQVPFRIRCTTPARWLRRRTDALCNGQSLADLALAALRERVGRAKASETRRALAREEADRPTS